MTPEATRALLSWEPVSPRILTARFNSKGRRVTINQCYAPTSMADIEDKVHFYEQIQSVINKVPARDMKILMWDLNAEVGTDNTNRDLIMGRHGTGEQSENGEFFAEFCTFNDQVIGDTLFPHKTIHKTTWTSPDGKTENQIDHITIGRKLRRSLCDVRVKRGADAASDHYLVVAELKTKLKTYNNQAGRPSHKFNIQCLKEKQKSEEFKTELRNKFSVLSLLPEETIEEQWHSLRETWKAQQPWAGRRGSTKSGLHLTPGHSSPRGRTLKTESTRRKIKRKSTNCRLSTGRRIDR